MTARVLVVDDVVANVRLLEAKLSAEYFEVVTALNGAEALEAVYASAPDIVLLDVMMPGLDGIEVCRRIKSSPASAHIPVILLTALDQPEDRARGLAAGADDFLTKPVNEVALFCRVKSLVRLKLLADELRLRTGCDPLGLMADGAADTEAEPGHILVIGERPLMAERIRGVLAGRHELSLAASAQEAAEACDAAGRAFGLIIVNLDMEGADALRICSQLKSLPQTRQTPILVTVDPQEHQRLLRALDIGVNDYLIRPIDRQELLARVATQLRRFRYAQQLRSTVRASLELAITDGLTGLYNRRYLERQLVQLLQAAAAQERPLSVLALDVDFFKSVNDTYGHAAGDRVLQELGARLRSNVRGSDLACRSGGEEFVVVLNEASLAIAERVGERIRKAIAGKPFLAAPGCHLPVTVSVGAASLLGAGEGAEDLLKRADLALYRAKREGRNRVSLAAA